MIRKQGLIGLLIFAALVLLVMYLLTDSWMESKLEDAGSSMVGAKVEIDDFDFSLFGLHVGWQRLQVTDPKNTMHNMVETAESEFGMEFIPLLSGKMIIENFQITGVRTNTERETDGKIEKEKRKEKKEKGEEGFIAKTINRLEDEVAAAPVMNMSGAAKKVNVDSIMKMLNLQTPERFENLKTDLDQQYTDWQKRFENLNYKEELKTLETQVKAIDVNKVDDLTKVQNTLKQVENVKKSADDLTKELKTTKSDLTTDLTSARERITSVDDWIREDYQSAMSKAKLPDLDVQSIGKMIFGKRVVDQVNTYLGYAQTARTYSAKLKSEKPEDQDPPRLEGQDIYFYNKNARPDFWIKKIELSGMTETGISLSGIVKNIVSDQRLIGAMTDFHFDGSGEGKTAVKLEGVFNYLEETPSEMFKLSYSDFPLKGIKLADSRFIPNAVESGNGNVTSMLELNGEKLNGRIDFTGSALNFDTESSKKASNKAEQMIQDIIRKTERVTFNAKISGQKDALKFALSSNLDELFARNLKSVVGKEVEKAKQQIRDRVDKEVGVYKSRAKELVETHETKLRAEIEKYEKQLEEKKKLIEQKKEELEQEKKKIEDKLDKEKKKLEDEAKKKLKKLF